MSEQHRELSELMGAYLLGDLDALELARLRAHLDGCSSCRAELTSLTAVTTALSDVDAAELADEPTPDAALEDRVLREVAGQRQQQQRRRVVRATALAVAACLLAILAFGLGAVTGRDASGEAAPVAPLEEVQVAVSAPGVTASADLVDHTWGLEIRLTADGLRDGVRYVGTVRDVDGREYTAGAFQGVDDTTVLCNMSTSVLRAEAASFVLRDPDGRPVLRSTL